MSDQEFLSSIKAGQYIKTKQRSNKPCVRKVTKLTGQGTDHIASSDDLCFNMAAYHVAENSELFAYCDEANQMLRDSGGFRDGKESMEWNDAPERTWPDVKAIFEKAIAKAEK